MERKIDTINIKGDFLNILNYLNIYLQHLNNLKYLNVVDRYLTDIDSMMASFPMPSEEEGTIIGKYLQNCLIENANLRIKILGRMLYVVGYAKSFGIEMDSYIDYVEGVLPTIKYEDTRKRLFSHDGKYELDSKGNIIGDTVIIKEEIDNKAKIKTVKEIYANGNEVTSKYDKKGNIIEKVSINPIAAKTSYVDNQGNRYINEEKIKEITTYEHNNKGVLISSRTKVNTGSRLDKVIDSVYENGMLIEETETKFSNNDKTYKNKIISTYENEELVSKKFCSTTDKQNHIGDENEINITFDTSTKNNTSLINIKINEEGVSNDNKTTYYDLGKMLTENTNINLNQFSEYDEDPYIAFGKYLAKSNGQDVNNYNNVVDSYSKFRVEYKNN